jgi:hypothetical protein
MSVLIPPPGPGFLIFIRVFGGGPHCLFLGSTAVQTPVSRSIELPREKQNDPAPSRRPGRLEIVRIDYHFMSATVRPAGINGRTCSVYGVMMSKTYAVGEASMRSNAARRSLR